MRILAKTFSGALLALISLPVFAVPFANGDFSSGLSSWNDASATGTVSVISGEAQLDTGSGTDPYSAILVQGDDGFFNFGSPITLGASDSYLNFDVSFVDLGVDASESGSGFFTDYLAIALYDALDFSYDLIFEPGIDSSLAASWTRFHLDISSLVGRDIALSFELADYNDGRNSRVKIDNITFTNGSDAQVPEPASIILLALGLMLMTTMRNSRVN